MARRPPSTANIAKNLGVSRATVSNVINGKGRVSEETRKRVIAALSASGYVRDRNAVALRTGRSRMVGVLVTDIANPFYGSVVSKIEARLTEAGYATVLGQSLDDPQRQAHLLEELIGTGVAGLIVNPSIGSKPSDFAILHERGIPTVLYVRAISDDTMPRVLLDDEAAGRILAEHLIDAGYQRVAMIGGHRGTTTFDARVTGARRGLASCGAAKLVTREGPINEGFGHMATQSLLESDPRIDAIIGHNDLVALGCLDAVKARGLRPGPDIGVAGFDNTSFANHTAPALTSVDVSMDRLGAVAAEKFLAEVSDRANPEKISIISPTLLKRASTQRHL